MPVNDKNKSNQNKKISNNDKKKKSSAKQGNIRHYYKKSSKRAIEKLLPPTPVKIGFLGGLHEVGKNMTLYEYEDEIILVDCGMSFPDPDMLGVDLVIPDFSYVEKNIDKIKGILITHGHEDHIGGLPYLLKSVNIPVYATKLTIGLISGKLKEHNLLSSAKLNVISAGDKITLGKFTVEAIHVNHSIPDAVAFAIRTKAGTIVQTGDFKIDNTPIDGEVINLNRFARIGDEGVLCMLSDSTNAERPGYTESERKVGESFENLFRKAGNRRIIVATFASNIHRVQQIIDVAKSLGRKVALSGRSLENVVAISSELGYLKVPEGVLISIDMIKNYTPDQLVLITTGSQGEPMSALSRMSMSEHRKVMITPNDYVIISAQPIPGNEKTVSKVINELMDLGAEVVYEKMYDVHVSGHACQEELKLLMGLLKPKYFIPVHGELKHLTKHGMLADSIGIDPDNIIIADNGTQIIVSENEFRFDENIPAGQVFVDGSGVGDVGNIVIRDRKRLSEDGLVIVAATVDLNNGYILAGPEILSRGFVYVREAEDLMGEAREVAFAAIDMCLENGVKDWATLKSRVRDEVSRLMFEKTKRSPMILPIFMEV
ncbi:MAG: ribonuclease J [Ruminococcaceae bacterium]|nr:ribonuclease J [Oscillospiraceae bacterium]